MLKIRLKERLFIIFFALFLAFYPPVVKYQEVQALEWAGIEVSYVTALKFILGLLGVTVSYEVTDDWWQQTWNDCFDYTMQDQTQTIEQVNEWWNNVKKGTLDTASSVWSSVKEWIQSKLNNSTGAVGGNIANICADVVGVPSQALTNDDFVFEVAYYTLNYYGVYDFTFIDTSTGVSLSSSSLSWSGVAHTILSVTYNPSTKMFYESTTSRTSASLTISQVSSAFFWGLLSASELSALNSIYHYWDLGDSVPSDWQSANDKIQDTAITTDDTTTTSIPDTIPLPWYNVSDTAEGVSDTIDALQEQVAEGVLSLEEFWERVQEMLGAIAIDTTTDETLPTTENPDTGEPEKIEDIANENISNYGFTLGGLEKVFPFCIPWDIYGFVTLLVAEPVAPVINYPFYNPVTNENIIITIDFSAWENVVVVFRYIFDFLLIIGLLLLARSLSGAGGDD